MITNDSKVAADVSAWHLKKNKDKMAEKLGIDQSNMTQEQADLLATASTAGRDPRKMKVGGEHLAKVSAYSEKYAMGETPEQLHKASSSMAALETSQVAALEKADDDRAKTDIVEQATLADASASNAPIVIPVPQQAAPMMPVSTNTAQRGGTAMTPRDTSTSIRRLTDAQMGLGFA